MITPVLEWRQPHAPAWALPVRWRNGGLGIGKLDRPRRRQRDSGRWEARNCALKNRIRVYRSERQCRRDSSSFSTSRSSAPSLEASVAHAR